MRRALLLTATLVLIGSGALAVAVFSVHAELGRPFRGYDGDYVDVEIHRGASATRVAEQLANLGVIRSAEAFRWWLWWSDTASSIHAGEYRFKGVLTPLEVADIVIHGRVLLHPVTLVEGATRWQVAAAITAAGLGDGASALAATERVQLISDLDPEATTLEGYLFPETYLVPSGATPRDLVAQAIGRFRAHWTFERRARARELEMSVREVVILASLIEAETRVAEERATVAGVFHNRLQRGMLLQTDPTVLYAMHLAGREGRRIRRSDLQIESPYNTYVIPGLPVGPIGNPRLDSIDAALHPADVDYLYFVSRNDGTHVFSRTLQEHNQMVNRYQR